MATRSIASLSLTFGLVSIPVKLYSATDSSAALRFKWMAASGGRVRQQFVAETPVRVELPDPQVAPAIAAAKPAVAASERAEARATARLYAPPRPAPLAPGEEAVIERSAMLKGYE